ncbi:hypothetical protein FYJ39_02355 [Clostridium sp. WCA-389-WT-23D1]|uniref:Uncharacterized protein n=2 Tax=Clostridiaceae TaxID=31979 RepID=A0A7X2TBU9_9CLOT|nr:hypothetical protein [Clostridium porci]
MQFLRPFAPEPFVRKGNIMKKRTILTMVLAAAISTAACSAMGKSGEKLPAENSVMIDKGGNVSWASVEPYDSSDGTEEELKTWAENKIAAFNSSLGKPAQAVNSSGSERLPVAIGSVAVGNGTATLITEYDTPSRLVEFAGEIGDYNVPFTALEVGRVASAGQSFEGITFKDEKGNTVDAQTVRAGNEKLAVKAEGQGIIKTENAILYISDGCTLQDSKTVQTAQEGTSYIVLK